MSLSMPEIISHFQFVVEEIEEMVLKEHLSPNRITTFKKCPKRFQYRFFRLDSLVSDDSAMELGSMLHRIVERFYDKIGMKDGKYTIPTPDEIKRTANICLEHEWLPRFQNKQRTVKIAVANFVLFEINRLKVAKSKKIPYKTVDKKGNLTDPITETDIYSDIFHAIVDWYWKAGTQLLDLKFGKDDTVYDGYKIQLSIERHVLEYNEMKSDFAGFGFFRKSPLPKRVATYNIIMLKELRMRLLTAIANNHFPRNKSHLCWYCSDYTRCVAEEKGYKLWSGVLI